MNNTSPESRIRTQTLDPPNRHAESARQLDLVVSPVGSADRCVDGRSRLLAHRESNALEK